MLIQDLTLVILGLNAYWFTLPEGNDEKSTIVRGDAMLITICKGHCYHGNRWICCQAVRVTVGWGISKGCLFLRVCDDFVDPGRGHPQWAAHHIRIMSTARLWLYGHYPVLTARNGVALTYWKRLVASSNCDI